MNFVMDKLVGPVVDLIRESLVKHVLYAFQAGDNVEAMRHEAEALEDKHKTVKNEVEVKERSTSMKCTQEVQGWLDRADDLLRSAREIEAMYEKRSCMVGSWCSLNCYSNHSISDKAIKLKQRISNQLTLIKDVKDLVSDVTPPYVQEVNTSVVLAPDAGGQLEAMRKKAIAFVEEGDQGVLGICGMGGVGKTTLLEEVNNSLMEKKFLHVMFIVASQGCTLDNLRLLIVERLGLNKEGMDLKKTIFEFLKDKDFVLLLDDVWKYIDLVDVGLPHPLGISNGHKRKVILTTRLRNVCSSMGTNENIIDVECLKWNEAWALFQKNVGEGALNTTNPLILELAQKVAGECSGHPLALITIGKAMANNKSVELWERTLHKLQQSRTSEITNNVDQIDFKDPNLVLKVSYDNLSNTTLQRCFLHCALWPEDHRIEKNDLIESWMGHGMLPFDDICNVHEEGHLIIDNLLNVYLLENVEEIAEDFATPYRPYHLKNSRVKMHDLVRDMALWVARDCGAKKKKWVVVSNNTSEEVTKETEVVSNMYTENEVMYSNIQSLSCLTAYLLRSNTHFLEGIRSNINIQHFHNLKYLELLCCNMTMDVKLGTEICRLEKLEYLNLSFYNFVIPKEMGKLINLKFLIFRGFLGQILLKNLKKLLVLDVFSDGYHYGGSQSLEDISSLPSLKALGLEVNNRECLSKLGNLSSVSITSLGIHNIPSPSINLLSDECLGKQHMRSNLKNLKLCSFADMKSLVFDRAGRRMGTEILELIDLQNLEEIIWRGVQPQDVLPKLRVVKLSSCDSLKNLSWVAPLPCLEHLEVVSCKNLIHILDEQDAMVNHDQVYFSSLRILILGKLVNLESISVSVVFPSLELLFVDECLNLKKLPFSSIDSCRKLQKIRGLMRWWDNLELDNNLRVSLQPLVSWIEELEYMCID